MQEANGLPRSRRRGVTGSRRQALYDQTTPKENSMSILWIILIVVLVLAVLGFFGRGRL
jgi:hypothetical protein